jgi:hypothetical protein
VREDDGFVWDQHRLLFVEECVAHYCMLIPRSKSVDSGKILTIIEVGPFLVDFIGWRALVFSGVGREA